MIKSLRKEFDAPKAPFVLATIAFEGKAMKGHGLTVVDAQLAVSSGKYKEFVGNVKTVEARGFWRDKSVSPNARQGYHYHHDAGAYMDVGEGLGQAMVELMNKNAKPSRQGR